ncbi:hypothetical protein EV121DRAFT_261840 [Schizophyllum commune]
MTTAQSNPRANLLSGLRTGGVRASSLQMPHSAAPTADHFNIHRYAGQQPGFYEEEEDEVPDMHGQTLYVQQDPYRSHAMTAAVDGPNFGRQQQHQQASRPLNPHSATFNPSFNYAAQQQAQAQAQKLKQQQLQQLEAQRQQQHLQMQLAQLELIKLQGLYNQNVQLELLAQQLQSQQLQQAQQQAQGRRVSNGFIPPASAAPHAGAFDIRAATLSAQMRRSGQAEQLGMGAPMTASLNGRFGSRSASMQHPVPVSNFDAANTSTDSYNSTTVISGGTPLGAASPPPSKSDSASSWRRGGNNNSVLSGNNRSVTSPPIKITPPRESSPSQPSAGPKSRPKPLQFNPIAQQPMGAVAVNDGLDGDDDSSSTGSSKSLSPTTPASNSSNDIPIMPLSPREEATRKLFEGLGIGRPPSANAQAKQEAHVVEAAAATHHRLVSTPVRQPRGPPSGAEELGPKNFATRIRRKAIGGLGALMGARERREVVEAY